MEECPWDSASDSEDDEWFYSSLTRYEHLLMYSLSVSAHCISVSDDGRYVCLAGTRQTNTGRESDDNELLVYAVPDKLNTDCPEKEGLSGGRDFRLRAGAFTGESVRQVGFCGGNDNNKLVSTGWNQVGVRLWDVQPEEDIITCSRSLSTSSLVSPVFSVRGEKCYLVGDAGVEEVDMKTWTVVGTAAIGGGDVSLERSRSVYCKEDSKVWFCDSSGLIGMRDLRSPATPPSDVTTTPTCDVMLHAYPGVPRQDWHMTFLPASSSLCVAAVGSQGRLCVLDTRSTKELLLSQNLELTSSVPLTPPQVSASPMGDKIAVHSGDTVSVYSAGEGNLLLQHDGHRRRGGDSRVVATAWHSCRQNLVFSSDSRQNLHAWSFPCKRDSL